MARPQRSGYRAVHLVVQYDGRFIEIQLRTRNMHEWAVAVERIGGRIGKDLKSGRGPAEVLSWLEAVADALAIEDAGHPVGPDLADRIRRLRAAALPYLPEEGVVDE